MDFNYSLFHPVPLMTGVLACEGKGVCVFLSNDDTNQRAPAAPGVALRPPQEWGQEQFGEKTATV